MPGPDRSWTITPTLLWFAGCLVVGLYVLDGGVQAVADRFTQHREPNAPPPAAGPVFTAKPAVVADKDDEPPAPPPVAGPDRSKLGALEDTCLDGEPTKCKKWAMDGFYEAVAQAKKGKLGRAVRVSWYGDSVVATDAIPGRLRSRIQGELGDGGPGFVFVYPPHRFCGHEAISRSSDGLWIAHAISTIQIPDGMYGVGGSSAETTDGKATIKLVAGTAQKAELYYLAMPKGGTATLSADGKQVASVETRNETKMPGFAAATIDTGAKKFEITTSGRVRLFGIDLENPSGAVVDNLGVISVNVKSFNANNAAHWAAELSHRDADLVMIMIGANEAEWLGPKDHDTRDYAQLYGKTLAEVRKARPDATCLVVSPTDQAEEKDGEYVSRPVMPVLVAEQRKAAHEQGCAFFSTYDWMGGRGSAAKWFRKGLVGSDFQHLSRKGANKFADAVFDALMAGYGKYAAH